MNQTYKDYLQNAKKNKISEHFTVFEIANSITALRLNIDNRPTSQVIINATLLIKNILEPLRNHFNSPVIINCMYRCTSLNHVVGGVMPNPKTGEKGSQHLYGQAADITIKNHTIQEVFDYIKHNMIFDQVIQEGTWIHVSFNAIHNRKQALLYKGGKYIAV